MHEIIKIMSRKNIEELKINEKKSKEFKKRKKKRKDKDEKQGLLLEKKEELWNYETKLCQKQ